VAAEAHIKAVLLVVVALVAVEMLVQQVAITPVLLVQLTQAVAAARLVGKVAELMAVLAVQA